MEAGEKALIDRYYKNHLSTVELSRRCLEDETITDEDITSLQKIAIHEFATIEQL